MTKLSPAEELLRQTFGQTTPMQSDERIQLEQADETPKPTPSEKPEWLIAALRNNPGLTEEKAWAIAREFGFEQITAR